MIDREARDNLAKLLLKYRNGEITGLEYLKSPIGSDDAATHAIHRESANWLTGAGPHMMDIDKATASIEEISEREEIIEQIDRTILFLKTDLDYRWRRHLLLLEPTLVPFQILAFSVCFPFLSVAFIAVEEATGGEPRGAMGILLPLLMVLLLTTGVLVGGSRLRSLFTGIDRRVWPFYWRQEYRDALRAQIGARPS